MTDMSHFASPVTLELTVSAVARRIGVAPATLRTWDRRYGLGPTGHNAGSHRRYSAEDVARLDLMRKLMLNGVLPGEAARAALSQEVEPANLVPQTKATSPIHLVTDSTAERTNVIALDSPKALTRSLMRAANMVDAFACDQILATAISTRGVVWTWENLLVPVLTSVGIKWEQSGEGIEIEHLLAESIMGQFRRVANDLVEPENARPVLLACAPHELHTIPIYAIAAGLAEHNIASRVLGARMPGDALAAAVRKLGPSAVVIWSQTQGTADPGVWDSIGTLRPDPFRMCAGPGWSAPLPDGVVTCTDFTSTLITLAAAAGR